MSAFTKQLMMNRLKKQPFKSKNSRSRKFFIIHSNIDVLKIHSKI